MSGKPSDSYFKNFVPAEDGKGPVVIRLLPMPQERCHTVILRPNKPSCPICELEKEVVLKIKELKPPKYRSIDDEWL